MKYLFNRYDLSKQVIFVAFFVVMLALEGRGQELIPQVIYSTYYGDIGTDDADAVTVDPFGNIYLGCHSDSPMLLSNNKNDYRLKGGKDAFIIKMNSTEPEVGYLTQLGGLEWDAVQGLRSDSIGNIYAIGTTYSSDFPIDADGFQPTFGGKSDAFIVKLNSKGEVVWSTFLGGSNDEDGRDIAIDQDGNIHVIGRTASDDFPTFTSALQPKSGGGVDAFFATLSSDGKMLSSTYLGGSGDDIGFSLDIDGTGRLFIAGTTNSTNFPVLDAFQSNNRGGDDLFFVVTDTTATTLEVASYWGGTEDDKCYGIDVGPSGDIFVMGVTNSPDLPNTQGAFQKKLEGVSDVFVSRLNLLNQGVVYSTYLGGQDRESPRNLIVDRNSNAYVIGQTTSSDFPTTSHSHTELRGVADAFVTLLDSNGSHLIYSALVGGEGKEIFEGVAIGVDGSLTLSGLSDSVDFPLINSGQGTFAGGRFDIVVRRYLVSDNH